MFSAYHAPIRARFFSFAAMILWWIASTGLLYAQSGTEAKDASEQVTASPSQYVRLAPTNVLVKSEAILRDLSQLPAPVARMRERILEAARSGDLAAVKTLVSQGSVQLSATTGPADDPIKTWRTQYPESAGIEVLSILVGVLEAGFVKLDAGTEREIYVWPYFAHLPLNTLDPPKLVELYRLLTAFDVQRMREAGSYTFFRLGISSDGNWHYFTAAP